MKKNFQFQTGFGLIEIVVAVAIISLVFFGLSRIARNFLILSRTTANQIKASYLLEEEIEAVRSIRDRSWSTEIASLSAGTTYYLYFDGTAWQTTITPQEIDDFTRSFKIGDVYRDVNDDIADSGTLDPGTKKFDFEISWTDSRGTSRRALSTYFTDFFNN